MSEFFNGNANVYSILAQGSVANVSASSAASVSATATSAAAVSASASGHNNAVHGEEDYVDSNQTGDRQIELLLWLANLELRLPPYGDLN